MAISTVDNAGNDWFQGGFRQLGEKKTWTNTDNLRMLSNASITSPQKNDMQASQPQASGKKRKGLSCNMS
eukprot:6393397-Amphidinium_carterae.1